MGISGSLTLEDTILTFNVLDNNQVGYTVQDKPTGRREAKVVNGADFMLALGLALSFNGEFVKDSKAAWKLAESVQPKDPVLRFIP